MNEFLIILKFYLYISEELFYQLTLLEFHNFGFIHLSIPAPIRELIIFALESCDHEEFEDLKSNEEIAQVNFFFKKKKVLLIRNQ